MDCLILKMETLQFLEELQNLANQQRSSTVQKSGMFGVSVVVQTVLLSRMAFHLMYSFPVGGPEFIQNTDHLHRWLNRVWGIVIRWEHSFATHQQLLVVLLERVLPHLDKPLLLTDYLMDSLDMGKQLL